MKLPYDASQFFAAAYRDEIKVQGMDDIGLRFKSMDSIKKNPFPYLRASQLLALDWLKTNAPAGSRILDVGCGQGAFLYALRNEGFSPVGVDPSSLVVKKLKDDGLEVYEGTIETISIDELDANFITMNLVLHHLENPKTTIKSLIEKFPEKTFLFGEGNSERMNKLDPYVLPPRALTLWNEKSLKILLSSDNREVYVLKPRSRPQEFGILYNSSAVALLRKLERLTPISVFSTWHKTKATLFAFMPLVEKIMKKPPKTLLAIATPKEHSKDVLIGA
jgi:SAM-dependent methyltransferase